MAQLTLRTLLAYIDDTLEPALARQLGAKVGESELARDLIERIKKVTRRRGLKIPGTTGTDGEVSDPNTVAEYLSDTLDGEQVTRLEQTCLESDVHLAEVAACHQILTLILTEPVRVPPQARQRMYGLVKPPASVPNRKPGKTLPVGGVAPTLAGVAEPDDDDATLLLGMGRYGGGSFLGRVALVAAALVLAGFLGVAVSMALPHKPLPAPDSSLGYVYAEPTLPASVAPTQTEPVAPVPTPDSGKPPTPETTPPAVPPPPPKPVEKKVTFAPPSAERLVLGKAEGLNVIVLTRPDNAPGWLRLDPAGEAEVRGNDPVLCLPGYKADVQLTTGVKVLLWGNVPELLPDRLVLESRVRFHAPERKVDGKGEEFDADITLLAGRIYLSTTRPAGGRVRVRFGREVWDVTLSDDKTDVMVQLISVFEAGMPYVRNRGSIQLDARVAVVRGTAGLVEQSRSRTFEKVVGPKVITWENHTRIASEPKPIEEGNAYFEKFPPIASDLGKVVQRALTEMAGRLTERGGVKLMLAECLTAPPDPQQPFLLPLAIYSQGAILYGEAAGDELKPLIDLLTDDRQGVPRVAVITALAAWIPHATGNSALLEQQLAPKLRQEGEPELILRLLRGYVSPTKPDPGELDRLVDCLNNPLVAVRELALWNLLTIVDPAAVRVPGLLWDVSQTGTPEYKKFVLAWQARVDEIKNRPPPKK